MFRQMIKKSIQKSQHCNRNWDLTQEMPQADIDLMIEAATQCPTKQNLNHYKTHVITDRAIIEKLEAATAIPDFGSADNDFRGYDGVQGYDEGKGPTNSQLSAHAVFAFVEDEAWQMGEEVRDPAEKEQGMMAGSYKEDRDQAVGIAAGYLNLVSTMMGYSTGCCKCFHVSKVNELLGLPEGKDTVLLMGIGIADPSRQRQEHHTDASFSFGSHKNMRTFETHYA
jgi:nitroreductase|tara:strand:+ start:212 stop:886 length:675 start_codon:yes stop_codon:yes gene_type:complete